MTLQGEVKRIFTGWMFAASPGLHAVEHPIYDVWLTDCKNPDLPVIAAPAAGAAAPQSPRNAASRRRPPRPPPPQSRSRNSPTAAAGRADPRADYDRSSRASRALPRR